MADAQPKEASPSVPSVMPGINMGQKSDEESGNKGDDHEQMDEGVPEEHEHHEGSSN